MRPVHLIAVIAGFAFIAIAFTASVTPGARPASAAGCFPARPHASGSSSEAIMTADGMREYILHIPPSYTGMTGVPVIFNFHGLGSSNDQQEAYSGLSTRADQPDAGFIAVYPQGSVTNLLPSRHWNIVKLGPPERDDVAFIATLLDHLEATLCVKATHVFSTGMSNGAQMSVRLACSLSSRIAAVAPVAGSYYPPFSDPALPDDDCPDTRAVPFLTFHGDADTCVPWTGGPGCGSFTFRLPIDNNTTDDDVVQEWAAHNGCTGGRQQSTVTDEVELVEYTNCTDGSPLQLYVVAGGGHTWPGSPFGSPPSTTQDISANDLMWQFFQENPFPSPVVPTPTPKNDLGDTDGDSILNSVDPDDDNDGCLDTRETQAMKGTQGSGGLRDPHNVWDFFDTPKPNTVPLRDKVVDLNDIFRVAGRFATVGTPGDPLLMPPKMGYHSGYDRTLVGPEPWDLGPADGAIGLNEIFWAAAQFAHNCT